VQRILQVGKYTCVAIGGDISDMQYIEHFLKSLMTSEANENDGHLPEAPHIHEYLSQVMYSRRSKMNPLWNTVLVAGVRPPGINRPTIGSNAWPDSGIFLAYVDLQGTTFKAPALATGFGAHLAQPIMRRETEARGGAWNVERSDAIEIIKTCLKVLYYRDDCSSNKVSILCLHKF
jgi:20S proteasome subunit beta 7